MSNPIPYFSDLCANNERVSVKRIKQKTHIRSHLGLPCRFSFKLVGKADNKRTDLFPPTSTPQDNNSSSILAQAETPRVLEKQLAEVNQSHFLSLAAANTAQTLVKVASKRARQFNPLNWPNGTSKKRKQDIFDL